MLPVGQEVVERRYLLQLDVADRTVVSDAHPVSVEFQDAAQAWWESEIEAEGLLPTPDGKIMISTYGDDGSALRVTGEVTRRVGGPGSQERCGRNFPHEAHSWAKSCRSSMQRWSERRECPGRE